jgi:asparagine synthase (glutamine-hydrolysing)
MCGIVGMVSADDRPIRLDELRTMCNAIAHRGPDDDGFYAKGRAGLGMRRLSIIDLSGGRQPICNEDGTVWVVFNGEIYNYRELRSDLESRGHCFSTTSDTEVIVHLYEETGAACVDRLRGMFAFAIWDEREQSLLLARDRLGIKPLYYAELGGQLIFASELKAILQLRDVPRELNWEAVDHFLSFLSTPASESILAGIHKLQPGRLMVYRPGAAPKVRTYWSLHFETDTKHPTSSLVERLLALLEESVRIHMVSDVPVGAFLSGGVDSASVVALMARWSLAPIKTFSIGFPNEADSELAYARMVSKRFGTDHYELVLEPGVFDIVEELTWHLDEPFGDSSAIPTYMVSKLAGQHVKVVLSGDGGDELFAGYDKYVVEGKQRRYGRLPSFVRKLLESLAARMPDGATGRNFVAHFSLPPAKRYLDSITLFRKRDKEELLQNETFDRISSYDPCAAQAPLLSNRSHWLSNLRALDFQSYLPLDILTKVDRMSMAHSLEVRPPLLDHKLVEFAATIPPRLLLRDGQTKCIFKNVMSTALPQEILRRPKQGFAIPLGRWFRGELTGYARDILLSRAARQRGIFRPAYIETLLKRHRDGKELDLHLWTLISFELWCRMFLDRGSRQEPGVWPAAVSESVKVA